MERASPEDAVIINELRDRVAQLRTSLAAKTAELSRR
jgi:hypothetical protein